MLLTHRTGGLVGSFGAILTILALGISTFAQQALRYDTIYPHSSDATVPIAQYMNGSGWAAITLGLSASNFDPQLNSAPYIAFYSPPGTNFTVDARCGTGNCTWEPYRTLALCNTCKDLTSQLKISTEDREVTSEDGRTTKYKTDIYTLPNDFQLGGYWSNQYDWRERGRTALLNLTTTLPSIFVTGRTDWKSVAFAENGSKLLSVFAVGSRPGRIPAQPDADGIPGPMSNDALSILPSLGNVCCNSASEFCAPRSSMAHYSRKRFRFGPMRLRSCQLSHRLLSSVPQDPGKRLPYPGPVSKRQPPGYRRF